MAFLAECRPAHAKARGRARVFEKQVVLAPGLFYCSSPPQISMLAAQEAEEAEEPVQNSDVEEPRRYHWPSLQSASVARMS